jgi:hypothetical protein
LSVRGFGFVVAWAAATLGLLSGVAVFDAAVDPYLVFGAPRIAGFNAVKPETETHTALAKKYLFARAHARGLIIGDSKADIGLDPESVAWPADARPVFNDGVPGVTIDTMLEHLRHDLEAAPIRRVLVTIELQGLLAPALPVPGGDGGQRSVAVPFVTKATSEKILALLSVDALFGSVATVAAQHARNVADMTDLGSTSEGGLRGDVAAEGERALFAQKDADLTDRFARLAVFLKAQPEVGAHRFDIVAEMIRLCRAHGAELDIVIPPYHKDYLDIVARAGFAPGFDAAKARLAGMVAAAGPGVRLWDFLGYDAYSTEAVPAVGEMRWWWEPTHFRKVLGEKLLGTVYQGETGFGARR